VVYVQLMSWMLAWQVLASSAPKLSISVWVIYVPTLNPWGCDSVNDHVPAAERHAEDLAERAPAAVIVAERWLSIAIAVFLVLAALLALGVAGVRLFAGLLNEGLDARLIVTVVDHLLLVLMLVEILHTVRQSIEARELQAEPFLVVGLIATVRRILLVTLETSDVGMAPQGSSQNFMHSMIELGVLAGLTAVLVGSIFVARRSQAARRELVL
jgi:uncharacterized membrane protein (DUF373 family)